MKPGLYLHVPFCVHKCAYCDFASGEFPGLEQKRYVEALFVEMDRDPALASGLRPATIFIGGGTPSLLEDGVLEFFLSGLLERLGRVAEWSLEANPGSLTPRKLSMMKSAGVTRLSLGVQSLQPLELTFLERHHDVAAAHRAMEMAQEYFPACWSADLIYGLPGQRLEDWQSSLAGVLEHGPRHLSCYELTWEPATALGRAWKRGEVQPESEERVLALQRRAVDCLTSRGLERYEISNWALPGAQCHHNDAIWSNGDYLAFGNGAHGRQGSCRYRNTASPVDYVRRLEAGESPRLEEQFDNSPEDALATLLLLGLRRREGIPLPMLEALTGKPLEEHWPKWRDRWSDFLFITDNSFRATQRGWEVLDRVILELLS